MRRFFPLLLTLALGCGTAYAQEDASGLNERLDRLERDINFMQKQVYRGGAANANDPNASASLPMNAGQLQARLMQMDEELRKIHGLIEQSQYQNKQTAEQMKKLSEDVEYRLRAMEQKQAEGTPPAPVATAPAPTAAPTDTTKEPGETGKAANYQPEGKDQKPTLTGNDFPNANAHYSYAFKLLNDKKFPEAATSFDAFVKKYPTDPLTSNAYYWLGESQYTRKDYTRATESFRKGFEAAPEGQKAGDNLYKLGMSLSQIKRTNEACIVLAQVISKYGESSARTAEKATAARIGLQCK